MAWSARADLDLVGRVTGQGPKVVRITRQNTGSSDVVGKGHHNPIDRGGSTTSQNSAP